MSGLTIATIAFSVTLLLSATLPFAVKPILMRLGVIDIPSERSSHERPILRGLGLAVLGAMTVGGFIAIYLLSFGHTPADPDQPAEWVILTCVMAISLGSGLLGFAEDLAGVSVKMRSILLLTIAFATGLLLALSANLSFWIGAVVVLYAVLYVSGYINVANFMDGLNGISGFHGVVAGITFALAGAIAGLDWLIVAGGILAAGFLGFLPWNLSKPGAFLGDVGSYLLGGATAATSLFAFVNGVPLLATIGPMVVYFGDVAVTLVKRVRDGKKWDEPHKEHAYQRLQQSGFSHVTASGITTMFSVAVSALGIVSMFVEPVWWILLFFGGLMLLVVYLRLPRMLEATRRSRENF